jgi:hypothetical protein
MQYQRNTNAMNDDKQFATRETGSKTTEESVDSSQFGGLLVGYQLYKETPDDGEKL